MKNLLLFSLSLLLCACGQRGAEGGPMPESVTLTKAVLLDKIRGGWAGQTIGCTYGGPTEFRFPGTFIDERIPISWSDEAIPRNFAGNPYLYDDVYMDLTFVEVMDREGLDATAAQYAEAFAHADYELWHANQAARYNILRGIMPPASGHWRNNPHANDIDFQIEADFIGMICPGMPGASTALSDTIGHIMNYGEGWYGGVYVAAMYSLAFVSDSLPLIVTEALKTVPAGSELRAAVEEVIRCWRKDPADWKACWFELQKKHAFDEGCSEGVFVPYNIDATINCAYVVMGLLYGGGDFYRTLDIATRCGQDSDCNPATAAGILGVMNGYEAIPAYWKPGYEKVEARTFPLTRVSLNEVYAINLRLLGENVVRHGGDVRGDDYTVRLQRPEPVRLERSFEGHHPVERRTLWRCTVGDSLSLAFTGNGAVLSGALRRLSPGEAPYTARLEAWIDGQKVEEIDMPSDDRLRKIDIFYRYGLAQGDHTLKVYWKNPDPRFEIKATALIVYADRPRETGRPD